jgi:capsular polysaccharide transport system permease protein
MSSLGSVSSLPGPPSSALARFFAAMRGHALDVRKQFLIFVALPTALAAVYYGFVASDLYVSHVEYLVRGTNSHQGGGLSALLSNIGLSRAADDASAVESFVQSRSAIEKVDAEVDLRKAFNPAGADFFGPFSQALGKGHI